MSRAGPSRPSRAAEGVNIGAPAVGPEAVAPAALVSDRAPGWAGSRWMRTIEAAAEGEPLREGLELNKSGKVREMAFARGVATAVVQERPGVARATTLTVTTLSHSDWERASRAMADQAVYAARLLAGELPPTIEDLLGPLGLRLFPTEASEISPTCNCTRRQGWCRHACALGAAVAKRLETEPFVIFELRGISSADLLDHLRARRAASGESVSGARRAGAMGGADLDPGPPLDQCLDAFWGAGPTLDDVDTTPHPPTVRHALLRRLGPSPFPKGGFPIIGLLASAYDTVSEAALRSASAPAGDESADPEMDAE